MTRGDECWEDPGMAVLIVFLWKGLREAGGRFDALLDADADEAEVEVGHKRAQHCA